LESWVRNFVFAFELSNDELRVAIHDDDAGGGVWQQGEMTESSQKASIFGNIVGFTWTDEIGIVPTFVARSIQKRGTTSRRSGITTATTVEIKRVLMGHE
jgi:hypothetical protein